LIVQPLWRSWLGYLTYLDDRVAQRHAVRLGQYDGGRRVFEVEQSRDSVLVLLDDLHF
jgi:hypothetical protein